MAPPSPVLLATSDPEHAITVNGTPLPSSWQLVSIDSWTGVNRIPKARLVLSDGDAAAETFAISETASLIPGVEIDIALGYGSARTTIFSGVIYRQGLEIGRNTPSRLVVEAADKAMAMTLARSNAIFPSTTDSDICQTLIDNHGLSANVTSSSITHEAIVQSNASDWDLLVMRAQASGMVVSVAAGVVTVAPPDTSTSPVLSLTYGQSIIDFRGHMDAASQFAPSAVEGFAWDSATQALVQGSQGQSSVTTPGNISSATLAAVFGVAAYPQQTSGAMNAQELTQWSSAELVRTQLAKIRAVVSFQGSALVTPGGMVTLGGLGDRFNGDAYVSGVHHRLADGLWVTDVEIGLAPEWFAETAPRLAAPAAAGQLPPINNLQIGVVQQIDQDPDGAWRVLVTLPLLQAAQGQGVWARFGAFYASNGIGANFYPEIGDEVAVGFLDGDPRYPVILASLYSAAKPPPYPPAAGGSAAPNNIKSFMTQSKLHIDFVEDQKEILVATPANQSISINDTNKAITLTDCNGNSVTLDPSGITIKSAGDISLSATGNVSLSADGKMTLSAQGSLAMSGDAMATLGSQGDVKVTGTMVQLNP